ncbi:MAG: M43 family zinc metalloprotease [Salibacteraceae bacterium]
MRLGLIISCFFFYFQMEGQDRCVTMEQNTLEARKSLDFKHGLDQLKELSADFEAGEQIATEGREEFPQITVPVVVHVLYREEENNISIEQIQSQIDVLNRDFAALNGDLDKVPEVFRNLAAGANIQFALADKDPQGNFTNGITRNMTTVENIGTETLYHRPERGGVEPWPQPHYLNVWVCELEGNALGFAILPSAKMSERDGIVMSPRAFGTLGTVTPPYNHGRTFVHEVGHYFGLRHLWGEDDQSCNSTDYIDDTPAQLKENFGCKSFPSFSCLNEANGDMFMNYMDYGNDTCMLFFTKRQVELMHLVLLTNRRTLFHSSGVTGVNDEKLGDQHHLQVYPNPSNGLIHIEGLMNSEHLIQVYNSSGQLVRQLAVNGNLIQRFDVSTLQKGVYLIEHEGKTQKMMLY